MILAESPPECAISNGNSEDCIAIWRTAYHAYQKELFWYNEQYRTLHKPCVRRWVSTESWTIISADLLYLEDSTDPRSGESPNDGAVTDFLLQRGRYKPQVKFKVGERFYVNVCDAFQAIRWPQSKKMSHIARLDSYLSDWFKLARTVPETDMPDQQTLVEIMTTAIRPMILQNAVLVHMQLAGSRTRSDVEES